ncbi:MAG: asparagine synthetase B, partial [Citromicrobium sp.]
MCGIAGVFHFESIKPVDPKRVTAMTDAMIHRGPDGSGVWTAPGVGLGHRRLSIIDIEGSPQPMHVFRTEGDTETILAAWQRWGPACLQRLDGMFAFAIYDLSQRQLFLARDRLGVKPLYLAQLEGGA